MQSAWDSSCGIGDALIHCSHSLPHALFHVTNQGACTWHELACAAVELAGLDPAVVGTTTTAELDRPAPRPANSVLSGAAWAAAGMAPLRHWREALAEKLAESAVRSGASS